MDSGSSRSIRTRWRPGWCNPAGLVPDLAGPKVYELADLIRGYLRALGKRRMLLPVRLPGKAGRAYRAGENLSVEGADVGKRTWEDFLAERLRSADRSDAAVNRRQNQLAAGG